MMRQEKDIDVIGESGPSRASGSDEALKKDAQEKTPQPASAPADAGEEAPALRNLESKSISAAFQALSRQAKDGQLPYRDTLAGLNALVAKCQESGLDQVGIEHAGFDTLRHFNLEKQRQKDRPAPQVTYSILSIDDARFLIRVHPGNIIDCYADNINKPQAERQYLDDDAFWHGPAGSGKASAKTEPKFFQYNLAEEEDRIGFVHTILQTAAATGAAMELREYDLPARNAQPLGKTAKIKKLGPAG